MATQQAKSILVRHRDNDKDPDNHQQPSKIQQLESSGDDTVRPTKIIDLNHDCLVKIFGRLDVKSLFNVAVANEWLQPAASEVYEQKFGTTKVEICKCDDYQPNTHALAANDKCYKYPALMNLLGDIKVTGLRASLQYLRFFGSSIENLSIDFNNSKSKRYKYVLQYISEYCAESLVDFSCFRMPNITIERQFQNVFSNLTEVRFRQCSLGQQWPSIIKCFPNVQNLYLLHNVHCKVKNVVNKSLDALTDIHIETSNENQSCKNMANLLQMADKLNSLQMTTVFGMPMNTLLDCIKYSRSLCQLKYCCNESETVPVSSEEVQQLISNHPELIEIDLRGYRFNADDAISVVRALSSLEEFRFQIHQSDYTYFVNQLALVWETKIIYIDSNYAIVDMSR